MQMSFFFSWKLACLRRSRCTAVGQRTSAFVSSLRATESNFHDKFGKTYFQIVAEMSHSKGYFMLGALKC